MLKGNSSTYKPMGDCAYAERHQLHLQTHGRLWPCWKAPAPLTNPWEIVAMQKDNSSTHEPIGGYAERQQLHLQTHGRLWLCWKATAPLTSPWVAMLKGNSSTYKPMGDCGHAERQQLHLRTHWWLCWKATAPLTNPWEIVAMLKGNSSTYKPMGGYAERQQLHLQTHGSLCLCWKATAPLTNPWVAMLKGNSSTYKPMGDCGHAETMAKAPLTNGDLKLREAAMVRAESRQRKMAPKTISLPILEDQGINKSQFLQPFQQFKIHQHFTDFQSHYIWFHVCLCVCVCVWVGGCGCFTNSKTSSIECTHLFSFNSPPHHMRYVHSTSQFRSIAVSL